MRRKSVPGPECNDPLDFCQSSKEPAIPCSNHERPARVEACAEEINSCARTDKAWLIEPEVGGDEDPGYGSRLKMISEAAVALLTQKTACRGGIWTPGAALRNELTTRLTAEAGILISPEV